MKYCSDGRDLSLLFYRTNNTYVNGVLATLVFEVSADVEYGEYPIEITLVEATNEETIDVFLTVHQGKIKVSESIVGDINSDGETDIRDSIVLAQYLAGWGVAIDEKAADCNGDGVISVKDIVLLSQYLADWDVTLV